MAILDNIKRILKEDYDSKYHDLIDKLAYVLNRFMEQTTNEVNGNLDFTNLKEEVRNYKVTVNGSGTPIGNDLISSDIRNPSGIIVINWTNLTTSTTFPTSTPGISFRPTGNVLKVLNISGLQADNQYNLTIRISP